MHKLNASTFQVIFRRTSTIDSYRPINKCTSNCCSVLQHQAQIFVTTAAWAFSHVFGIRDVAMWSMQRIPVTTCWRRASWSYCFSCTAAFTCSWGRQNKNDDDDKYAYLKSFNMQKSEPHRHYMKHFFIIHLFVLYTVFQKLSLCKAYPLFPLTDFDNFCHSQTISANIWNKIYKGDSSLSSACSW